MKPWPAMTERSCDKCEGDGWIDESSYYAPEEPYECPDCNGTGVLVTEIDQPRLSLLVVPSLDVAPHLFESLEHDHRQRLQKVGAHGPWITVGLREGRALWFGTNGLGANLRVMTMQAALGLPVVEVAGPAIITGLAPDTIIEVMRLTRGTLTAID